MKQSIEKKRETKLPEEFQQYSNKYKMVFPDELHRSFSNHKRGSLQISVKNQDQDIIPGSLTD